MSLDSYTLLVASSALLILLGAAFAFLWLRDRRTTHLLWWGVTIMVTGIALISYIPGDRIDSFVSVAFGNAARLAAAICLWFGIRRFEGRRPLWWAFALGTGAWILLCLYPPFLESVAARIIGASLGVGTVCFLGAYELWRSRGDGLRARTPTMAVFASLGLLMFVRIAVVGITPYPVGALDPDPVWVGIFAVVTIGHIMFAAIFFLAMTMERREAEQRGYALSDPLTGLLNRRAFDEFAQRMSRRRLGTREPLGLLVLDLDRFKQINDQFGHEVGDRILKLFAEVAEGAVRPTDQLFRIGGEEFCFMLPDTTLDDAIGVVLKYAERHSDTLVVITVDENGGWWDHVAPPKGDRWGPGTRIPALVVSPFAKKGFVDHTVYDTGSIARFITRRFGLQKLPGLTLREQAMIAAGGPPPGDLTAALQFA